MVAANQRKMLMGVEARKNEELARGYQRQRWERCGGERHPRHTEHEQMFGSEGHVVCAVLCGCVCARVCACSCECMCVHAHVLFSLGWHFTSPIRIGRSLERLVGAGPGEP